MIVLLLVVEMAAPNNFNRLYTFDAGLEFSKFFREARPEIKKNISLLNLNNYISKFTINYS